MTDFAESSDLDIGSNYGMLDLDDNDLEELEAGALLSTHVVGTQIQAVEAVATDAYLIDL